MFRARPCHDHDVLRLSTLFGALLLAVGVVACSPAQGPVLQPRTERNGPAGPVPPGLEKFYGQQLAWGPCADYATSDTDRAAYQDPHLECARLTVPMDYADPQGRTVTLGLLRSPATDPQQRIGSLLVNPGGPGASGMSTAASLTSQVRSGALGEAFDLVGFDPRGVASSEPQVRCLTDQEWDAERLDSDADTSPAGTAQTERENREYVAKCAERSGEQLLANMGTRDVVKDVDVLRSALGDPKLNYLGYSYGTRIGSEYAEQFPANVRSMVLDGAIDPNKDVVRSQVEQGAGFQRAFDAFADWCAGQDSCALGPDPRRATESFQDLVRPLNERPVPAGEGRQLSYSDATTAAIQSLYSQSLWEPLNTGLAELSRGRGDLLMQLADTYYERSPDGSYANITDAYNAVRCVDDQRVTDPRVLAEADRRYREAAPFLDDGQPATSGTETCASWPVPVTGEPGPARAEGAPPPLVISTTGDPATPYQAGVDLANALHGGLLTFEGTQHTAFLQGSSCVDGKASQYLLNGRLPEPGTRCGG